MCSLPPSLPPSLSPSLPLSLSPSLPHSLQGMLQFTLTVIMKTTKVKSASVQSINHKLYKLLGNIVRDFPPPEVDSPSLGFL